METIAPQTGLCRGITGILAFTVIILAVDGPAQRLSFGQDWILARNVNLILMKERRMEQER